MSTLSLPSLPSLPSLRAWADRELANLAPARRFRMRRARDELERDFGGVSRVRVLDAGSQTGLLALELASRHPGWQVVAADLDVDALRAVDAAARRAHLDDVQSLCLDLTRPIADGQFDAATAIECLAEIPDDDAVLRTLAGALCGGGLLYVHVPRAGWRPVLRGSPREWYGNVRGGYAPDELIGKLVDAGLDPVDVSDTNYALLHLAEEIRYRWLRRCSPRLRLLALPLLRAAAWSERRGLRLGSSRGVFAIARRR